MFQGVSSGILAAAGYGLGVFVAWLARALVRREPALAVKWIAWRLLVVLGTGAVGVFVYLGSGCGTTSRLLVDAPAQSRLLYLGVVVMAVAMVAFSIAAARGLFWIGRKPGGYLSRRVPAPLGVTESVPLVALLAFGVVNGYVVDRTLAAANVAFGVVSREAAPGVAALAQCGRLWRSRVGAVVGVAGQPGTPVRGAGTDRGGPAPRQR